MKGISLAAALLVAAPGIAMSQQQDINWTQTINMPKGANVPRDRADILGIELGDSYAEAKAKLEKLAAEGVQRPTQRNDLASRMTARMDGQADAQAIREEKRIYELRTPGASSPVRASFVQVVTLSRQLASANGKRYSDSVTVTVSAPSSGHQVIGVSRSVTYGADGDQPLVADVLAQLKAKMKFDPQTLNVGQIKYRFQFDNGQPFTPNNPTPNGCLPGFGTSSETYVKTINETGNCDAFLEMSVQSGISRDHASILNFILSDNDRAKANLTADFAFLSDYVRNVQQNMRAAPPKL